MYRNQYDNDCTTWSPQGRIYQIEYACEGVKQGTCAVGLRSNTHVVLCGLRRSLSKLASYNSKLRKVADHVGMTFSGITADAKTLARVMQREAQAYEFVYEQKVSVGKIIDKVGTLCQLNTQRYSKRPFGVGLLVAGYDRSGAHLYETSPTGNYEEYYAVAFGNRSQSSKTYLERNFTSFEDMSLDDLIFQAIKALGCSLPQDQELSLDNVDVGVVGKDTSWHELSKEELEPHLLKVKADDAAAPAPEATVAEEGAATGSDAVAGEASGAGPDAEMAD